MASAENGTGELGDFGSFYPLWTQAGTTFPALDLSPDANNHSATGSLLLPLHTGTCSAPKPFSKYQTQTGGDCL